jgi:hypothetical protein
VSPVVADMAPTWIRNGRVFVLPVLRMDRMVRPPGERCVVVICCCQPFGGADVDGQIMARMVWPTAWSRNHTGPAPPIPDTARAPESVVTPPTTCFRPTWTTEPVANTHRASM